MTMNFQRWILFFIWLIALIPAFVFAGNFSTAFDSWSGISNMHGDSCWVIPYNDSGKHRAYFTSSCRDGGIRMKKDMDTFRIQRASVEFFAPNGISDHLDIGIQGRFTKGVRLYYF
jgi:hypothetical protein